PPGDEGGLHPLSPGGRDHRARGRPDPRRQGRPGGRRGGGDLGRGRHRPAQSIRPDDDRRSRPPRGRGGRLGHVLHLDIAPDVVSGRTPELSGVTQTRRSVMRRMRIRRPSPSLVISCLALFIALGGAAYATQLKKNSVGTKQIKKNAVTTAKLKKKSVTTAKIKPGAITGSLVNLSTFGTVPSATNATNVSSVLVFSVGANDGQLVSLAKTANFELMGFCDPKGLAFPPGIEGSEKERTGTTMVIYN